MTPHTGRMPLHFEVRTSDRARRVRLVVTAHEGLVVVVPRRWRGDIAQVVESRRDWAEKALASVSERRALLMAGPDALLPDRIGLAALGMSLPVEYRQSAAKGASARTTGGLVAVTGDIDDADACLASVRRWLARTAREELPKLVTQCSAACGLVPSSIRVTSARTRWGSCSARATVSIHRNALFLPEHLARALVLHELAHLRVLSHSPAFWAALAELDPDARRHRLELRAAGDHVPAWADF